MPPSKFGWNFPFYNVMQLHTTIQSDTSVKLTVYLHDLVCSRQEIDSVLA